MIATRADPGIFATSRRELWPETGPRSPPAPGEISMTNGNGAPQEAAPPQLNVLAQYTKDLSFENPNAPCFAAAAAAAAGDQHPDQRPGQQRRPERVRGDAAHRGQGREWRQGAVLLRSRLCRRVPHRQRAAGEPASAGHDRVPAAVVPVRARDHRNVGARRRLPAADAGSRGFRRPLPAEHGAAGRAAAAAQAKPS